MQKTVNQNCLLTVSIPAYNDSLSLVNLVEDVQSICTQLKISFKVLIINDGSIDNTLEVSEQLAAKYNNITIVNHETNLGFGATLKQVFTIPETEWILFLPGDNQFPAENLLTFIRYKDNFDFVIGKRVNRKDTKSRKIYSLFYNWLLSSLTGCKVTDVNSIVFYRRAILNSITLNSTSAFIHAELFLKVVKQGFKIKEAEAIHQQRAFGFGRGGNLIVMLQTLLELLKYIVGKI